MTAQAVGSPPLAAAAAPVAVPVVWVVSSHRELHNEHGQPQQYTLIDEAGVRTLVNLGLQPVCYPRVPPGRLPAMLATVQGVLMGGSATNVHPALYGEEPARDDMEFDRDRDAVSLPLVRLCIERGVPLIGFCRGCHEINVALGGSLHQDLKEAGGGVVHWENPTESLDEQYAERHAVDLVPGGALERLTGCTRLAVSSLHSQGVRRLAPGLVAEAVAEDGLIEAFRWHDDGRFAWGFQFHPEWNHRRHPAYGRIMAAYVDACLARLHAEAGPPPALSQGPMAGPQPAA
jgi:putative glutamine amidotransferase